MNDAPLQYYPFTNGNVHAGGKKLIGVSPLDLDKQKLLHVDREYKDQLTLKSSYLEKYGNLVCDSFEPNAEVAAACHDVLLLVVEHIKKHYPECLQVTRKGAGVIDVQNRITGHRFTYNMTTAGDEDCTTLLKNAGLLCQEDLCVMMKDKETGDWRLRAGFVAFPYDWHLQEKLGKSIFQIHKPVPGFERVVNPVNKVFDRLKTDNAVFRGNHGVVSSNELYYMAPIQKTTSNSKLYLRVELQTVYKLREGAALFSIRTYVTPLEQLAPKVAKELILNMKALPRSLWLHRNYQNTGDAAIALLESVSEGRVGVNKYRAPLTLVVSLVVLWSIRKRIYAALQRIL